MLSYGVGFAIEKKERKNYHAKCFVSIRHFRKTISISVADEPFLPNAKPYQTLDGLFEAMEPALPGPDARPPAVHTDHLLEEILVRIDAPADLARASAACKAFRRLTTDPTFCRRYGSIHPPPLLGLVGPMSTLGFLHAVAPHPHARSARAFADSADFGFVDVPLSESVAGLARRSRQSRPPDVP